MACSPRGCNCAVVGSGVTGGSGSADDPYQISTGVPEIVTSATRPASPYDGQLIWESDTDRMYMWRSSAWRIVRDPSFGHEMVWFTPGSTIAATTTSTLTSWITMPDVVVPPWATEVDTIWTASGIRVLTGSLAVYTLRPRLEGVAPVVDAKDLQTMAVGDRYTAAMQATWAGLTPGATLTPEWFAARDGGDSALEADTIARFAVRFDWKES